MRATLCTVLTLAATALSAAPNITNLAATQEADGTGSTRLRLTYDLATTSGPCVVSIQYSTNGGGTFAPVVGTLAGDAGAGITAGTGRQIDWALATDLPNQSVADLMIRVLATDANSPLAVTNAGFEADAQPNATLTVSTPPGWSTYGTINGSNDVIGTLNPTLSGHFNEIPEGTNIALCFLNGPTLAEAGLQQTLTSTLEANRVYTLTLQVGNINEGTANFGYFDLTGFPGYRVALMADGIEVATDNNTLAGSIAEGFFEPTSVTLVTGPTPAEIGDSLGIRLVNLNISGTVADPGIEVNFDDVRLTAAGKLDSTTMAVETVAPTAGSATPPANASAAPVNIPFSGAADASGIALVELWYRPDAGSWTDSGLTLASGSGSFNFVPPGASPANHGDYHFALVAVDTLGNRSATPSGSSGFGDGTTNFDTSTRVPDWQE